MKVLILGVSGLLGNSLYRYFSKLQEFHTFGLVRCPNSVSSFSSELSQNLFFGVDVENFDHFAHAVLKINPDLIINCIGMVKQLSDANDPLKVIPLNSLLPHKLAKLSDEVNARLIHFSTDCVFSGNRGFYAEMDVPDSIDLYGRSKLLGELTYTNTITLRTSIIGHEINSCRSLVDWFLSQRGVVKGYKKAIFSGLPTVEIGRVLKMYVIPNASLHGLYHLSAGPISKYDLLKLVAEEYEKKIDVVPDSSLVIDRSLNSSLFRNSTGFTPKSWPEMVRDMRDFG